MSSPSSGDTLPSPSSGNMVVHQRRLLYTSIAFLVFTVTMLVVMKFTPAPDNDETKKLSTKDTVLGTTLLVAYGGLGISVLAYIILTIIIFAKKS